MSVYNAVRNWFVSLGVLLWLAILPANGQQPQAQPPKGKAQAQPHRPADPNETYTLQTYEVGDLIISVQDHPYSDQLLRQSQNANANAGGGGFGGGGGGGGLGGGNGGGGGGGYFSVPDNTDNQKHSRSKAVGGSAPVVLCQFGGGGGNAGGGSGETGAATSASASSVSMDDLIRVLVSTVAFDSWAQNGGEGKVEPLGTALVVYQTPAVHHSIVELLDKIREPAGRRKTITIDARWLMLTSDDLDALMTKDASGGSEADRKTLAALTRRSGTIRGLINCFSGQLVYLTSGTNRNVVSGWIPVVGAIGTGEGVSSLVATHGNPQFRLVQTSTVTPGRQSSVGYQPIIGSSNLGALLEIRPTIIGTSKWAIVELKSTLTAAAEHAAEPGRNAATDALAPAVDRVAVETLELATTMRMPLGKPIVVGGMTYMPRSAKTQDDAGKSERQQLYLVLEVR
jgi:hypothetical protein